MKMWVLSLVVVVSFGSTLVQAESLHAPGFSPAVDFLSIPGGAGAPSTAPSNPTNPIDACVPTQGNPAVRPGSERTPSVSSSSIYGR